jgi:hypothetical protein
MTSISSPSEQDRSWFIVGRWQEFEGEARANLLRIIGLGLFYIVHLMNYYGFQLGPLELPKVEGIDRPFHQAVTALTAAWSMVGMGVLLCLRRQFFPWTLKFFSTACDIILLTSILSVADGPKSPLIVGYFLIIALSTLRFNLPLVWCSAVGSMAGYLFLLGQAKWFRESMRVPRYQQIIVLLALLLTGIVLGQVIRRVRAMAVDYAQRRESVLHTEGSP